MPLNPPLVPVPGGVFILPMAGPARTVLQAAGRTPVFREDDQGMALPPAGASRADTLFSTVGLILVAVLILSALLLLFRRGR